ncbi:DnaJ C-terminal domain-containing protein [Litorimonas sp. RW-G-Af-16]|uniref:DnaJ C-terminal domain-containing protein n=1 Tax=Litorimonas sp. RW-G-Af-16 TaxID=3241168 RepID=UPI00390C6161
MAKNPYTLLGVEKTATEAEIRKAYRALAKKLHPDLNPDDKKSEERFKEVTAAYNLLSDKKLRQQYDTGQVDSSGQQQNPFAGGFQRRGGGPQVQTGFGGMGGQDDMADLFSSLFGMNMNGMRGGMGRQSPRPQKGADIRYKMTIGLKDALKGGVKPLGPDMKVKIPAGIKDGQTVRMRGKGKPGINGGPAGDVKVEIEVLPHKSLRREGDNLYLDLPISLFEAMNGAKVKIDMPTGTVQLSVPAGTNTGKKLRLKGKGVKGGDLLITPIITLTQAELGDKGAIVASLPVSQGEELRRSLI